MSDRQPNPRPHLRSKSGSFAGFGHKDCCCSPVFHSWGGVRVLASSGNQPQAQFQGALSQGSCFQGRLGTDDANPASSLSGARFFPFCVLNVEPPTQPATHDARPRTSVLHQLPWLKFSHTSSIASAFEPEAHIGFGLTAEGKVYGWGCAWPLPKYNDYWAFEYADVSQRSQSERAWMTPVELDFQVGTGTYISADVTGIRIDGNLNRFAPTSQKLVLVDTNGEVHVGFFVSGQGQYEIGWNTYSLDAKDAIVAGVDSDRYHVIVLKNDGNIEELRFATTTNTLTTSVLHQYGMVTKLNIQNPGVGYPFPSTRTLSFAGGGGSGTSGTAGLTGGVLSQWQVFNLGQGYTSAPTVTIVNNNAAVPGTITAEVDTSKFAQIFLYNGSIQAERMFFAALTENGNFYVFHQLAGGGAARVSVLDPGVPYVSAGLFARPGAGTSAYGLRQNGDVVELKIPGSLSAVGNVSTVPAPVVVRSHDPSQPKFLQAAFSGIASNAPSILAIDADNRLWAYGQNNDYRLGDGTNTDRNSFVQIGQHRWKFVMYGRGFSALSQPYHVAFAIHDDTGCDQDDC